jgi:hypothetical protein
VVLCRKRVSIKCQRPPATVFLFMRTSLTVFLGVRVIHRAELPLLRRVLSALARLPRPAHSCDGLHPALVEVGSGHTRGTWKSEWRCVTEQPHGALRATIKCTRPTVQVA